MNRIDKMLLIGIVLIVVGIVWALGMKGIGLREWLLLVSGIVLGILSGMVQGSAIVRYKRGKIGRRSRTLWVVGVIIVLVILKVAINVSVPSYLATSDSGIWLSIVYAIGGLFVGRSFYSRPSIGKQIGG